ncbi:hypothetical protein JHK87_032801 [Glycine soja]|nr:hypothetical protein JHK87_032801 [Glycine soja]
MEVSASASKWRNNIGIKNLLLILLFFHFSSTITAIRKDVGFQIIHPCKTTVQGRYLLSDDNGCVRNATSVNSRSRCCPQRGEKVSCHGCNLLSQCCNSYEYCVSCFFNPALISKEQVVKMKVAKPATARTYSSVFDYCAGRCCHSSESVVHENAYISDFHHCFSLPSSSSAGKNSTLTEARLSGINVVVGRQGESCNSVCKSRG